MKTKIHETPHGVTLEAIDPHDGEPIRWHFHVGPSNGGSGGYVYRTSRDGNSRQVCYGLSDYGDTLMSTDTRLLGLIRREWQAYRRHAGRIY